jgi:hypothetical protein
VSAVKPDQPSTERLFPYGRGIVGNRGVSSRPSMQKESREPHSKSMRGKIGSELNIREALVEAP